MQPYKRKVEMNLSKKRTYRKGIDPTENQIQMAIIDYLRTAQAHKQGWTFYAVPNDGRGGKAHKIHAWKMGQLSGVGDVYLNDPQGYSMYIEVKRCDGIQSKHQIEFQKHCETKGIPYEIARSLDDAKIILDNWGFGKRKAA
jgi:hypothetical protein